MSSVGAGAPSAGAAPGVPSRLKGTIVGVAPPTAGAAPAPPPGTAAFEAPPNFGPPPGFNPPSPPESSPAAAPPPEQHQFGSAQGLNPLGATVALDGPSAADAMQPFGAPPGDHGTSNPGMGGPPPGMGGASGGYGPPGGAFGPPPGNEGFGAAPPMDGGMGGMGGMGGPPGGQYGAPPPGNPYGAPPGQAPSADYGAQMAQGFNPMGQPMQPGMGQMQPYGGGAPMMGAPGMAMAPGAQKSWMTTLLLALFAGTLGVHRFYTGHMLFGALQLVTCGGFGVWTLIDIIFIVTGKYTDAQGRPLAK
jgi:TM2 domain-containing membrane protein YozV